MSVARMLATWILAVPVAYLALTALEAWFTRGGDR